MTKLSFPPQSVKSEKLTTQIITITPLIARQWLDSTDTAIQRRVSYAHVAYLAKEMKNGHWDLNGQPIQIDKKGNVVNGQHRLNACIQSDTPFTSLVVFDVETSAIKTIDEGSKPRSISDFIDIRYNAKNSNTVAASIRIIAFWDAGWRRSIGGGSGTSSTTDTKRIVIPKPSPAEVEEFIRKNPGFFDFINEALSLWNAGNKAVVKSVFCGMLWIVERENPVYAREFFGKLSVGINIKEKCPLAFLRKTIEEDRSTKLKYGSRAGKYTAGDIIALIVKSFNYYVEGVEVPKLIQVPKDVPDIIRSKRA